MSAVGAGATQAGRRAARGVNKNLPKDGEASALELPSTDTAHMPFKARKHANDRFFEMIRQGTKTSPDSREIPGNLVHSTRSTAPETRGEVDSRPREMKNPERAHSSGNSNSSGNPPVKLRCGDDAGASDPLRPPLLVQPHNTALAEGSGVAENVRSATPSLSVPHSIYSHIDPEPHLTAKNDATHGEENNSSRAESEGANMWRKYGKKRLRGSGGVKAYYKCCVRGCKARRTITENGDGEKDTTEIGEHSHATIFRKISPFNSQALATELGNFLCAQEVQSVNGLLRICTLDVDLSLWRGPPTPEDGRHWRKYGQKQLKSTDHTIDYYRGIYGSTQVRKIVRWNRERSKCISVQYCADFEPHTALQGTQQPVPQATVQTQACPVRGGVPYGISAPQQQSNGGSGTDHQASIGQQPGSSFRNMIPYVLVPDHRGVPQFASMHNTAASIAMNSMMGGYSLPAPIASFFDAGVRQRAASCGVEGDSSLPFMDALNSTGFLPPHDAQSASQHLHAQGAGAAPSRAAVASLRNDAADLQPSLDNSGQNGTTSPFHYPLEPSPLHFYGSQGPHGAGGSMPGYPNMATNYYGHFAPLGCGPDAHGYAGVPQHMYRMQLPNPGVFQQDNPELRLESHCMDSVRPGAWTLQAGFPGSSSNLASDQE